MADHPFQVLDRLQRIKANILERDRNIDELVHAPKLETVVAITSQIRDLDQLTREHMEVLGPIYRGSKDDLSRLGADIDTLRVLYDKAIALKQAGRQADAIALIQPEGERPDAQSLVKMQKMLDAARSRAGAVRSQSDGLKEQSIYTLLSFS